MNWLATALAVALCAAAPLLSPAGWARSGPFPDAAVLAVVHVAFTGGRERAALFGMAVGLASACLGAEPLGQQAFLLGGVGWVAGSVRGAVFRDRLVVQMTVAGACVLLARAGAALSTALDCRGLPGLPGPHVATWALPALLAAVATALALPPALGLFRVTGLLAGLERGRGRDV